MKKNGPSWGQSPLEGSESLGWRRLAGLLLGQEKTFLPLAVGECQVASSCVGVLSGGLLLQGFTSRLKEVFKFIFTAGRESGQGLASLGQGQGRARGRRG